MRVLKVWIQYEDDRGEHMRPVNIEDLEMFGVTVKAVLTTSTDEKKGQRGSPPGKQAGYGL